MACASHKQVTQELWKTLCGLRIDISIGGPIWAMKGWPSDTTFNQILTMDTVNEHIVFSPFTRPEVNGSTLVGHYASGYQTFDGLLVATRRRVFRRNPNNTVNLNLPSITLDIHDVELIRCDDKQIQP
jgi:hypothetical protein